MKPFYIFDLDGTLSDNRHRNCLVDFSKKPLDWSAFSAACDKDPPLMSVVRTLNLLVGTGAEIWIFSSREESAREKTEQWLHKYTELRFGRNIESHHLILRPTGDHTPDDVLKEQWLDALPFGYIKRLVAVFEDRETVVKMWRKNGIACFHVAPHAGPSGCP